MYLTNISEKDKNTIFIWYGSLDNFNKVIEEKKEDILQNSHIPEKYVKFNLDLIIEDYIKDRYNRFFEKYLIKRFLMIE